jgi:hypothetical protein
MYSSSNIIPSVKSRKMRWAGHVTYIGRTEMRAGLWWGNLKVRDNLEIQGVFGRVILKDIEQRRGRTWSGFIWPNIETSGGLF